MPDRDLVFFALRARAQAVIDQHVAHYYPQLTAAPRIDDLARWFRRCQWNARAALYLYFLERIVLQCEELQRSRCTRKQARAHLARLLGVSPRTVERYTQMLPWPEVRSGMAAASNGRSQVATNQARKPRNGVA